MRIGSCDPLSTPRALGPLFDLDEPALMRLLQGHATRDEIFRFTKGLLTSADAPIVLAIEDAHWADEATFDLLRFLGRRMTSTRSLVIVTYRDDETGPHHPLRRVLGDLASCEGTARIRVPPLSLSAVALLAKGYGRDPVHLHALTGGNPFFVTEILAANGDLSPNVHDAVLARATRLQEGAWSVLEAVAVFGSHCDLRAVDHVIARRDGDLEACLDCGMLTADGAYISFRHELARQAILSSIAASRAIALHRRAQQWLAAAPDAEQDSARLAYHAERAGDREAAYGFALVAARNASRLGSHREAADQLDRALRHATALPDDERARLLESLADACYLTAQIERAISARVAAREIWISSGNRLAEGENSARLAALAWAQARIGDAEREAEAAVAILEAHGDRAVLAKALSVLARLRGTNLESEDAIALAERAALLAAQSGDDETHADALTTLGEAWLIRNTCQKGTQLIERGMAMAAAAGCDHIVVRGFVSLGHGLAEGGNPRAAIPEFQRGIEYCSERDLDLPLRHLTALLSRCELRVGNWNEAWRGAQSVLQAVQAAPASRFLALVTSGVMLARQGQDGASAMLDEALALANESECINYLGPIHVARAEAAYLAGDSALAHAEASSVLALARERGHMAIWNELAYWIWKCGALAAGPPASASPYMLQIAGDWERAAMAWESAGLPHEAARARAESWDEPALRLALETFERLGAGPAATQVRQRLHHLGARHVPRGPRPSTRGHPAGLTRRELDVAMLLAGDLSNQQIADRLFLSPRTVEHHVASVLSKLGASTRSDVAGIARDLGLSPQST
jgi:DNA-binding CsgD family transcriptional regulator/tetratricopeptide (TPR) repeat protein